MVSRRLKGGATKSRLRRLASATARIERLFDRDDQHAPLVSADIVQVCGDAYLFLGLNTVELAGDEPPTPELAVKLLTQALWRAKRILKEGGGK